MKDRQGQVSPILDIDSLEALIGEGGLLAGLKEDFEIRPGQQEMLRRVAGCFLSGGVLAVEAGTGVGKSLAYGLPAAAFAVAEGSKVVISSATINLQRQLVDKDLPLVARLLGGNLRCELVKGRGNYICLRRLHSRVQQMQLGVVESAESELARVAERLGELREGSIDEIGVRVDDRSWEQIRSDSDICLGKKCRFRPECFFARARQRAERAQLLVVNHHLLLADLSIRLDSDNWERKAVLPAFSHLVIDEAHELEDSASSYFGARITMHRLKLLLGSLGGGRKKREGLVPQLVAEIEKYAGKHAGGGGDNIEPDVLLARAQQVEGAYRAGFESLGRAVGDETNGDRKVRLDTRMGREGFVRTASEFSRAADLLRELAAGVERAAERLGRMVEHELCAEAKGWAERAMGLAAQTDVMWDPRRDELVRWVEWDGRKRPSLNCTQIDLAPVLRRAVFEPMDTVVLTSATLTVAGRFDFLFSRIGLDESSAETLVVESPFEFDSQAVLAIPVDIPPPGNAGYQGAVEEAIVRAVAVSAGATLVLFTSWTGMRSAAQKAKKEFERMGLELLVQGQMPRHRLVEAMRQDRGTVLFGLDSFWQGIDIAGPALRHVVITRLPFDVPGEPLIEARGELVARRGGSPFRDFSLPRAVLKLKQGFGRLIRSSKDRGAVTLLDTRVLGRSYGSRFLDSLPPARRLVGTTEEVFDGLARFFSGSSEPARHVVPVFD